jgi:hypothetical protein
MKRCQRPKQKQKKHTHNNKKKHPSVIKSEKCILKIKNSSSKSDENLNIDFMWPKETL